MRINKTRQNDSAASVQDLTIAVDQTLDLVARPYLFNATAAHEQRSVSDGPQLTQLCANAWPRRSRDSD
jgi:hypothetical protein